MLLRTPLDLKSRLRSQELDLLHARCTHPHAKPSVVLLGPGGIGKSTLLACYQQKFDEHVQARIDLGASRNRSALGVASALLKDLDANATAEFFQVAATARLSGDDRSTRDALSLCEDLLSKIAITKELFILDNIDRASMRVRCWLLGAVFPRTRLRVLCAGRTLPTDMAAAETVEAHPFGRDRLELLSAFWLQSVRVSDKILIDFLVNHSEGHPVRAELIAWALSCFDNVDLAEKEQFQALINRAYTALPENERRAIASAISASQRVTAPILSRLAPGALFEAISALPFAAGIEDAVGGYVLHPVALDLLENALALEPPKIEQNRRTLTDSIYPRLIAEGHDEEATAVLELERLRYLTLLSTSESFEPVERAFHDCLSRGQLWRADEIAHIAAETLEAPRLSLKIPALLLVIEDDIAHHDITEATEHLNKIPRSELAGARNEIRARVQYLRAKCVTSPAALRGGELFTATSMFEAALQDVRPLGDKSELAQDIRFELGQAYRLVARYEDALVCFKEIESNAKAAAVRVRALEEQAHLYRHTQDLEGAEAAQGRAALLRNEYDIKLSGHGLYCLATLRRDSNLFESAATLYERALNSALEENDDYLACLIKGDWAWMKFLDGDTRGTEELLTSYQQLAELYSFSRELSECWHMRYHLEADAGRWPRAYENLNKALHFANEFGNIVMQLDCMMHLVQRAASENRLSDADQVIKQMEQIEAKGCPIRIFRGRARIYQGDGFVNHYKERDAVLAWREGFEIIANYGESRSNVELLGGLLRERSERFFTLLNKYPDIAPNWPEKCEPRIKTKIERILAENESGGGISPTISTLS